MHQRVNAEWKNPFRHGRPHNPVRQATNPTDYPTSNTVSDNGLTSAVNPHLKVYWQHGSRSYVEAVVAAAAPSALFGPSVDGYHDCAVEGVFRPYADGGVGAVLHDGQVSRVVIPLV